MATVGQVLSAPEAGWQRLDDTNANISYVGASWSSRTGLPSAHNGTDCYINTSGDTTNAAYIGFTGTKIRLIAYGGGHTDVKVTIDGVSEVVSFGFAGNWKTLIYEKTGLSDTTHEMIIRPNTVKAEYVYMDAIDIGDTAQLVAAGPWVNRTKTTVDNMVIGDRIKCRYTATSGALGTFSELGSSAAALIPATATATPDGSFYFIMVGYDHKGRKKLIADRSIQHSVPWNVLNSAGLCSVPGAKTTIDGNANYILRLLSGGITSSDTSNEWDKIIRNSTLNESISAGDNSVWNWNVALWSNTNMRSTSYVVLRGYNSISGWDASATHNDTYASVGFRPVLLVDPAFSTVTINTITPTHLYEKHHSNCDITATVLNNSAPANFRVLVGGVEVSALGATTTRSIPLANFAYGNNTVAVESFDGVSASKTVNRETLYRLSSARTALAIDGGYTLSDITLDGTAHGTAGTGLLTTTDNTSIDLEGYSGITSIAISAAGGMYAISFDGRTTWYSHATGSWVAVTSSDIATNGMTYAQVNALTTNQIGQIFQKTQLDFMASLGASDNLTSVTLTLPANQAPVITGLAATPDSTHKTNVTLTGNIADAEGDSATYRVLINSTEYQASASIPVGGDISVQIPYTNFDLGTNEVKVESTDARALTSNSSIYVTRTNTTPVLTGVLNRNLYDATIGDSDNDQVQYRVLFNGVQKVAWTQLYDAPHTFSYEINKNEINYGVTNTLRIEIKDDIGTEAFVEEEFVGDYYGLLFTDTNNEYYSDDVGAVIKKLDFGTLVATQTSVVKEVQVYNKSAIDLQSITVSTTHEIGTQVFVELSSVESPFNPQSEISLGAITKTNKKSFYTRITTNKQSYGGGDFNISVLGTEV